MLPFCEIVASRLHFDGCDLVELARTYGTPLYVMSETAIRARIAAAKAAFVSRPGTRIAYASKAYQTLDMCRLVADEGLSLDVVSGGELYAALKAGFPAERVLFHGNNKSEEEIRMAVEAGLGRIVLDNERDIELTQACAERAQRRQGVLVRITPGVDAHTHAHISTGGLDSKFGMSLDPGVRDPFLKAVLAAPNLELLGFHFHVGSQLLDERSHILAIEAALDLMAHARSAFGFETRELNLGGGFGVRYSGDSEAPSFARFATALFEAVDSGCAERGLAVPALCVEPGRSIVAAAGLTLYSVGSVKARPGQVPYVAVDGGMPDNPRPSLYGARYEAVLANRADEPAGPPVTIAGKCCESGDILIHDIALPPPRAGDFLAVFSTGAYNLSMASNYNRLPRPAVVQVKAGTHRISVRRETWDDLIEREA